MKSMQEGERRFSQRSYEPSLNSRLLQREQAVLAHVDFFRQAEIERHSSDSSKSSDRMVNKGLLAASVATVGSASILGGVGVVKSVNAGELERPAITMPYMGNLRSLDGLAALGLTLDNGLSANELLQTGRGNETQAKPTPTPEIKNRRDTVKSADQEIQIPENFELWGVRYEFDRGVSQLDRLIAIYGGAFTELYMAQQFNWIPQNVTIQLRSSMPSDGRLVIMALKERVIIDTLHPEWLSASPVRRIKFVAHEFYHTLQSQIANPNSGRIAIPGARWLIEGSAELVAYNSLAHVGATTQENTEACWRWGIFNGPNIPLPSLQSLESLEAWNSTPGNKTMLAALAIERLIARNGINSLKIFHWVTQNRDLPWQGAFQVAFGTDPDTFYRDFENWRRTLPVPSGSSPCLL